MSARVLVTEKIAWEATQSSFVTDRTTLDNLAYTMFHDISTVDANLLEQVVHGLRRYTHVIYCPVKVFCDPGGDPNRVQDMTYHHLYDVTIKGLLDRHLPGNVKFGKVFSASKDARRAWIKTFLELP